MEIKAILAEIDAEIFRLQQAKTLLSDTPEKRKPGRRASKSSTMTAAAPKKRQMSAEGRARIAAAQKARWAAAKKKAK